MIDPQNQAYREASAWLAMFERPLSYAEWCAVMRDAPKHARLLRALVREYAALLPSSPATLRELEVLDPVDTLDPDDPTPPPPVRRSRASSALPIDAPVEMTSIERLTTGLIRQIEHEVREAVRKEQAEEADTRHAARTPRGEYQEIKKR